MLDVKLVSHTKDPIKTLYTLWEASRSNDELVDIEARHTPEGAAKLFQQIVEAHIPVAENIQFTWLLENVPVSFREQMVRHRIGVTVGDQIGVDMVPDLSKSSWWSQSMRILDMSKFAEEGRYFIPESVAKAPHALEVFKAAQQMIQDAYASMVDGGIPMQDAREIIPLGATHRISWTTNLTALLHIIGKRTCWILQAGYWHPIIKGMLSALREIDPIFDSLAKPPCIKGDCFAECVFKLDNERRVDGDDNLPPCPLFVEHHVKDEALFESTRQELVVEHHQMISEYSTFWRRDPWSGEKL